MRCVVALLSLALGGALVWALVPPPGVHRLPRAVAASLAETGVANPVTAVLLNFRGYDTLLEVAVLLLGVIAVWSLGSATSAPGRRVGTGPVLDVATRLVVPAMVLVGVYLLWGGAHAPGGAFQAGALLGGAGVLVILAGILPAGLADRWPLRALLALGLIAFVGVGALRLAAGARLLELPPAHAGLLTVLLEAALAPSIAVALVALFAGRRAAPENATASTDGPASASPPAQP